MIGSAPRRALIMAGGGLKVAFQAGVLQVWLDEARDADGQPLIFDIADGASGGVLNLALWCQGSSGRQIADHWRAFRPLRGLSINWPVIRKRGRRSSLLDFDALTAKVFRKDWALDWDRIRATAKSATFNLFNVTEQRHEARSAAQMNEDALISAISLPMWFPAVRLDDRDYIDSVYATDANLEAAIRAGADELWIVWTVSQRGITPPGMIGEYFGIIESAANAKVREALERIERNNAVDGGRGGEYGRRIEVRWLAAEVPAHYLLSFSRASMREAVERGVAVARDWCRSNGFAVEPERRAEPGGRLVFRERMQGGFTFGSSGHEHDPSVGGEPIALALEISTPDVDALIADPAHAAHVRGEVVCEALGGRRPITAGTIELLTDDGDPFRKRMTYRLLFSDSDGDPITLIGNKTVIHQAGTNDLWPDTSALHTWLYRGDQLAGSPWESGPGEGLIGSGVITLAPLSFLRQLTTFRTGAGSTGGAGHTLFTFGQFFLRQLWQVYAHPTPTAVAPQLTTPTSEPAPRLRQVTSAPAA